MIKYRASLCLLATSSLRAKYQSFRLPGGVALLSTAFAAVLMLLHTRVDGFDVSNVFDDDAYRTFATIVGFISVFRTSQAYSRFWEGADLTFEALGDWFDVVSTLLSFCRYSLAEEDLIIEFQQKVVRLVSLLNAMIYCELEDQNMKDKRSMRCELIDVASIDRENLVELSMCENKPEVVFQWLQNEVVDSVKSGVLSIPPPLLTRSFQEMGAAMKQYHRSLKFTRVPFPFPYTAVLELLLVIHGLITPVVVCSWTENIVWACLFTFVLVFAFWSLHFLAGELENPFDSELNDLNMNEIQRELNQHLLALASDTSRTVRLSVKPREAQDRLQHMADYKDRDTFRESFATLNIDMDVGRRSRRRHAHHTYGFIETGRKLSPIRQSEVSVASTMRGGTSSPASAPDSQSNAGHSKTHTPENSMVPEEAQGVNTVVYGEASNVPFTLGEEVPTDPSAKTTDHRSTGSVVGFHGGWPVSYQDRDGFPILSAGQASPGGTENSVHASDTRTSEPHRQEPELP
eukprot:CAMPEP_0194535150 /NCGR_PEP_ID=MMETSP0253-20130528/73602_1 /TAXON_ID=2966 /ORGANISM="Noctiluca scintillans" /LENGTH=516 /DNA_ID=CAMNT_0039380889 /DNA_START=25 /DNA_END=1575 /DNA_ORIENTATION=+